MDPAYSQDPVTGGSVGAYQTWRVVGCVLTFGLLALTAGTMAHPALPVVVMPLVFTLAWSIPAPRDETGMWAVGAIGLFLGASGGAAVASWVSAGVRTLVRIRQDG